MEGEERIPTYLKVVQMQKDRLCNNGRKDLYHGFIGVMVGVYRDLFFGGGLGFTVLCGAIVRITIY